MAFSADIIVTALQELMPGYQETWTKFHPAFDHIVSKGNKTKASAPFKEFGLVPEGPGTLNTVIDGDEYLVGGRRQSAVRGNTYATTLIYVWDLPHQDLRDASTEADVVGLIKKYPDRAIADFEEIIAQQLVMGNGPGAGSFFTLNGDATYNPKGLGARQGMFDFVAAASQTNTVFGVAKNSIVGWHNQYAHITSMGGNGLKQIRKAYWNANQQGAKANGDVDLMISDRDSFDNYVDEQVQFVEFVKPESQVKKGDPGALPLRSGIKFSGATWYPEQYMVPASFTTTAATEGVIYGLHTSYLHCYTQGSDAKQETNGDFAFKGPIALPTQDMSRFQYVLAMGMYSDNLRCQFAVTGGANV
jgi:hypothetical protein